MCHRGDSLLPLPFQTMKIILLKSDNDIVDLVQGLLVFDMSFHLPSEPWSIFRKKYSGALVAYKALSDSEINGSDNVFAFSLA